MNTYHLRILVNPQIWEVILKRIDGIVHRIRFETFIDTTVMMFDIRSLLGSNLILENTDIKKRLHLVKIKNTCRFDIDCLALVIRTEYCMNALFGFPLIACEETRLCWAISCCSALICCNSWLRSTNVCGAKGWFRI